MNQRLSVGVSMVCFATVSAHAQPVPAHRNPNVGQAQIQERELRCRGGANLQFTGDPQIDPTTGWGKMSVQMSFGHSSTSPLLRGGGMDAGTCSWTDRTMTADEPSTLTFLTGNPTIRWSPNLPDAWAELPGYPTLKTLKDYMADDHNYWTFMGVRSGHTFKLNRHYATIPRTIQLKGFKPPVPIQP